MKSTELLFRWEAVSKKDRWILEVHFINWYAEKDVTIWDDDNKSILGEKLYNLLNDNEWDYKEYITKRVQEKRNEFDDLTQVEEIDIKKREWDEDIEEKDIQQILYWLGIFEKMIDEYRVTEWDSRLDNDDKLLVGIKEILKNGIYSIANTNKIWNFSPIFWLF